MRQEFVECKTKKQAEKECPWAEKIVKVEGGYRCFESSQDYKMWRNQNKQSINLIVSLLV
jgi:hypothetical protein